MKIMCEKCKLPIKLKDATEIKYPDTFFNPSEAVVLCKKCTKRLKKWLTNNG